MDAEQQLREKLRKIEALFAGATTPGEKAAADAAADRIRARLKDIGLTEKPTEMKFSLSDPWSRQLFVALCRRYGIRPYRYPRMRRQTIIVRAPQSFLDDMLWPEFVEINDALVEYLAEITNKVIREEVFGSDDDVEEVAVVSELGTSAEKP